MSDATGSRGMDDPGSNTPPFARRTTPRAGGEYKVGIYAGGAGTREYGLYIPTGYRGQQVPLVVMLHGCTQTPQDLAASTRMNNYAEENTFIAAYPAQIPAANRA